MKTLIKNGTVITADQTRKADILVEDEIIRRIDANIDDVKLNRRCQRFVSHSAVWTPTCTLDLPMFG